MTIGVRGKLLGGFGFTIFLLAIIASFGLYGLYQANQTTQLLAHKYSEAARAALEAQAATITSQRDVRHLFVIGETPAAAEHWKKNWPEVLARYKAAVEVLERTIDDPDGRAKLDAMTKAFAVWEPVQSKIAALAPTSQVDAKKVMASDEDRIAVTGYNAAMADLLAWTVERERRAADEMTAAGRQMMMWMAALSVLAGIVGFGVAFFLARSISQGIREVQRTLSSLTANCATDLAAALDAMAKNDLTVVVTPVTPKIARFSTDEIGQTANLTNQMRDRMVATIDSYERARLGLQSVIGQVQKAASSVAETSGQLDRTSGQASSAVQQVTHAVQNVASGSQETTRSAQASQDAVAELGQAIDSIARGASEQARQVQAASLTAMRMADGVAQVASTAQTVAATAERTTVSAEHGATAVRETVDGMAQIQAVVSDAATKVEELGRLGEKIGAVVETIDDIAEQTNLLALNAAIEAARAGEHGRGFAVVADEVRKLAERSQRETKSISELIRDVQAGTKGAVNAMQEGSEKVQLGTEKADQAGTALAEILQAVQATVGQVTEIAAAAREMSSGAQSVVEAMESISAVVEENTASTEEMAAQASQVTGSISSIAAVSEQNTAAAEEVSASAEEMSAQVEEVKGQAEALAETATILENLMGQFSIDAESNARPSAKVAGAGGASHGQGAGSLRRVS